MSDIVERLRVPVIEQGLDEHWIDAERAEAADEIERLRAALLKIANMNVDDDGYLMTRIAKEALDE